MSVAVSEGHPLVENQLLKAIREMPKIDLHRHLEGSVRLETLVEVAQERDIPLMDYSLDGLRPYVQMMPGEPRNWQHFLQKFRTLRLFFQYPDVVRRIAKEAVEDAAADNIRYLELRFTPKALGAGGSHTIEEIVGWVCESVDAAMKEHNITVRLILSMNRHESPLIGEEVLDAALAFKNRGVVGIDLAGQEPGYPAAPFVPVFERARAEGLGVTIHAGEWGGPENVREAVEVLYADRIGHGVRVIEDPALMIMLAARGTVLEVCPSSNYDSGVVPSLQMHPLPLLFRQQVRTTINTDDPSISNITLSDEMGLAVQAMTLSLSDLKLHTFRAAQAAFLPGIERGLLLANFETWLAGVQAL